jgi:hypothetical protein
MIMRARRLPTRCGRSMGSWSIATPSCSGTG